MDDLERDSILEDQVGTGGKRDEETDRQTGAEKMREIKKYHTA